MNKIKCKNGHTDGWVVKEEFAIDFDVFTDVAVECECNHLGCGDRKKLIFNVMGLEDADEQ